MTTEIQLLWKKGPVRGNIRVRGGRLRNGEESQVRDMMDDGSFAIEGDAPCRLSIAISADSPATDLRSTVVTVDTEQNPFSFFLRDVDRRYPIWIAEYGAIATEAGDRRTYSEIEADIRARGLKTRLQQLAEAPEESYDIAAAHTRALPSQTWLGLARDIRIFNVGMRGVGGEELLWDWVQPKRHGLDLVLPETDGKAVRYRYLLGRGIGCEDLLERRLEDGVLPILHARRTDEDIVYDAVSFVTLERSPLTREHVRGTSYLVADRSGHGFMHTPGQQREAAEQQQQAQAAEAEEETVLYMRATATNTAMVPRYAYFKNVVPNDELLLGGVSYSFDGGTGYASFAEDRIFCVSRLNGAPLNRAETAVLLMPGEEAAFELRIPHRPLTAARADRLARESFDERRRECAAYWRAKLNAAARIRLPERRIEEMLQAGQLHLDLVTYGLEPEGTLVPTIGHYTAIGSESAPIIQFMDSLGLHGQARRAIRFFFDKQHEDGFIQNFNGYMLETGAALWTVGEHYRYTRDAEWLAEILPQAMRAYRYLVDWRLRNSGETPIEQGCGMLDGKVADPEDPFHSFMLNGYAYMGMARLSELLRAAGHPSAAEVQSEALAFRTDIRAAFNRAMALSPVVPIGDGSWVPTAPPWTENRGPMALYADGHGCVTHGSVFVRDALLGPLYLAFQEVLEPDGLAAEFLLQFHSELTHSRHVALSQPYYSVHPWLHLKRGETKAFLKAYYNGFAGLADRETYTFWEHYWHCSAHKTHEEAWFLMQTRWMLYMEEGDTLSLLAGAPSQWFIDGSRIELEGAASYFGKLDLFVEAEPALGRIEATIKLPDNRRPASVRIRLPHPFGQREERIEGGERIAGTDFIMLTEVAAQMHVGLYF